jgi:hypothetical protein
MRFWSALARPSGRLCRKRPAIGLGVAAVLIVAIISASAVAIFWIGVSSRVSSSSTLTVTVTETSFQTVAGNSTSQASGSQSATAQVAVTEVTASAADFATRGRATSFTCNLIAGSGAYLVLTNTGTQSLMLAGLTIAWAGASNAFSPPPDGCQIGPAGSGASTLYINLPDPATVSVPAATGQTFQGAVSFSDAGEALFTGTFQ